MAKKIKGPSKTDAQERIVRKEKDLNPTGRVLWLLTSLSGTKDYAYMAEDKMADQLNITVRQVRNSLALIKRDAKDGFQKEKAKGFHRVNRWRRVYLPKEEPHEFVRRMQAHPIMDLCTGMTWVAIDGAKDTGVVVFAACEFWNATRQAFRQARIKMNALGYFTVESDPKTGKPATYTLNEARFAAADHDTHKAVEEAPPKPTPTPAWVAKQEKIAKEKLAKQEEERRAKEAFEHDQKRLWEERQAKSEEAAGASLIGMTAQLITAATPKPVKRTISAWGESKAKAMIDENDL